MPQFRLSKKGTFPSFENQIEALSAPASKPPAHMFAEVPLHETTNGWRLPYSSSQSHGTSLLLQVHPADGLPVGQQGPHLDAVGGEAHHLKVAVQEVHEVIVRDFLKTSSGYIRRITIWTPNLQVSL